MQVSSKRFSVKSKNNKYCFNCCEEILELLDILEDIENDYSEFQVIVMWSQDNVKLCKMSIVFSSSKAIKDTSPTYQENIIHT